VTTTILIADDHVLFRQGLVALLREQAGWEVVAQASEGEEAVRLAEELKPQIAVLDVEMPRLGGIEAARRIRQVSRETRIVALSMYGDAHYQERMTQAGASAYVLKNEAIDQLVDAIKALLRGEAFVSPTVVRRESVLALRSAQLDKDTLSARERDVLRLLAQGKRTKEIADALGVSAKTVETYRSRLMQKLGIDNVPGLVRFAIRAGLVSPES
jgi:DNA-binding NarL/FixJ family response regulator